MKNKSVKIVVTVPAADMARLQAHVRPLGVDALKVVSNHLQKVGNLVDDLVSDHHVLLCYYTFPSRRAAQLAVNHLYKGCSAQEPRRNSMEVSFIEAGKSRYERLYPPGVKQVKRKLDRLTAAYAKAKAKADKARMAIERVAGVPIAA